MESLFDPVPNNPVKMELSITNEKWPRFNVTSNVNFTVNYPLVPSILSSVDIKPTSIIKLFCDHPNLPWEHVNKIPCPLTSITKGPEHAGTRNFTDILSKLIWISVTAIPRFDSTIK